MPLPAFTMEGDSLELTTFRSLAAARTSIEKVLKEFLTSEAMQDWEWILTQEKFTASEYEKSQVISHSTALRNLKEYLSFGMLERRGAGPSTHYVVKRS